MSPSSSAPALDDITVPRGFVWGMSTSSYQIQGAAREDGRQRFGITCVDYPTQRRMPKASFHGYAGLIRAFLRPRVRGERQVSQTSSR